MGEGRCVCVWLGWGWGWGIAENKVGTVTEDNPDDRRTATFRLADGGF